MPQGVLIPVDEAEPLRVVDLKNVSDYQKLIGGWVEVTDLDSPEASIWFDEEGKLKNLPLNRRASLILWMHNPSFRDRDVVKGPAIVLGPGNEYGETQDVPAELKMLLTVRETLRVEVQTADNGEAWNTNQRRFPDWVDAYNFALALSDRWMAVERVRVVPA